MSFRRDLRAMIRPLFPADAQVRHGLVDAPMQPGTQVFILPQSTQFSAHDERRELDADGKELSVHNCLTEVNVHVFNDDPDVCESVAMQALAKRSSESFKENCRKLCMFIVEAHPLGMMPIADVSTGAVTYRPRSIISITVEWRYGYKDDVGLIENIEMVGKVQDDGQHDSKPFTLTLTKGEINGE